MWLGRQHISFISDYVTVFPNVRVLLFFKNTKEQFSSTIDNFHVRPKLPFPYASIFLYFIIIAVNTKKTDIILHQTCIFIPKH